ncbi:MAG: copper amine oxidase N-terminal domain-containing protein [Defluviitaleaceae bacterium]|nr:copper amine oxidase N-terminal domain-containing protein [Defluviitaleaceae bacterium]
MYKNTYKKELKGFIAGIIFAVVITGTVSAASPAMREIFFNVRINLNGANVDFAEDSRPFTMNDRVFVPVRTIAELLGLEVNFVNGVVLLSDGSFVMPVPPAPPTPPVPPPQRGSVFESTDFGLSFSYPDSWHMSENAAGVDFTSPLGASVKIRREPLAVPMSAVEFIAREAGLAAAQGVSAEYALDFPETTRIGWFDWHFYKTTMNMQILGVDLRADGHYFVNVFSGTARVITVVTTDVSESFDEILSMFGAV